MATAASSSIPYAQAADLRLRHDFRQLGDLLNDDNTRVTNTAQFDANPEVSTALMDATGMIEMYGLKGQRYTAQDMQTLTGAGRNLIVKLCIELAWWMLWDRRHSGAPMQPIAMWAFSVLEDLGSGATIFGLVETAEAGVQESGFMSCGDWQTLNLATNQATRAFGVRAKYRVPGSSNGCDTSGSCGCD